MAFQISEVPPLTPNIMLLFPIFSYLYLKSHNLDCDVGDFNRVVAAYGLQSGVSPSTTETQLNNFAKDAKVAVHCVSQHSGDYKVAAEVNNI